MLRFRHAELFRIPAKAPSWSFVLIQGRRAGQPSGNRGGPVLLPVANCDEGKPGGALVALNARRRYLAIGYNHGYTPLVKTAISIPDATFEAAERLAERTGMSRSELYAAAVAEYLARHRAAGVRERLDAVYDIAAENARLEAVMVDIQAPLPGGDGW